MHSKYSKLLIICLAWWFTFQGRTCHGQIPTDELTEDWLLQQEPDNDDLPESSLEEWRQLTEAGIYKKIDLNKANRQQLLETHLLSMPEIEAILAHRNTYGMLLAWYELQAIPGFSPERIGALSQWFMVSNGHQKGAWRHSFRDMQHRLLMRTQQVLQAQEGFSEARRQSGRSHYLGPQHSFRIQYRQAGEMHQVVASASREPGEPGIDRFGGHISLQSNGKWNRILIGDYHLRLGEGLINNTLFSSNRHVWLEQFIYAGSQVRGASGLQQFGIFRGIAATYQISPSWQWMPWVFAMPWSGQVKMGEGPFHEITSIRENGLHRTPTEIAQRNSLHIRGFGTQLQYLHGRFQTQLHGQWTRLSGPIVRTQSLHQHWLPSSQHQIHVGMSHKYQQASWHFQGELAWQHHQGLAILQQLYIRPDSRFQLRIAGRYYDPRYFSFFANSVQRGSRVNNEQGILWNMQWQAHKKWQLGYMCDFVEFPWMRYLVPSPSQSTEQRVGIRYTPSKTNSIQWQLRLEELQHAKTESNLRLLGKQQSIRSQLRYKQAVREDWEIQWTWGINLLRTLTNQSQADMLSVQVRWKHQAWQIAGQFTLFDAPDFDNRFFIFEPDVLYGLGMSSLNGQGNRLVGLIQYKSRYWRIWLRYAQSVYFDRDVVGSGLDQSQGNMRSQLNLQVQLLWR